MGVPISAMGIASGRTCCHCSPTAVSVNTRRSPLHITAHMSVRGEDMAGSWGEGFMLGCSARRGQHIHTLQRGHLIGPAKAFFEGGTQQSARADTALCFASDSVSDPDAEGPDSTADSASDSDSDFSQQNGQQGSSNYSASGYTAHDLRVLWDSVGRPLLRVGRAGVQKSHGTSLADLLSQHALVKVQLNAASAKPDAVGSELGEAAGAVLLQCKGRTLLMASGKDGLFTLLAAAGQSVQQSAAAKQRKLEVREQARQGPPELKAAVALRLRVLEAAAVIALSDFDAISIRALSALPEAAALKILEPCNKKSMRAVRNRSAWLTSQCRRLDKPIALPRA